MKTVTRRLMPFLFCAFLWSPGLLVFAADPVPIKPKIDFPKLEIPTPPQPQPSPVDPNSAVKLGLGQLYVVGSDTPLLYIDAPQGVVDVQDVGPGTISGKFIDGSADFEIRKYKQPYVYLIRGLKPGTVELITLWELKKESAIRTKFVVAGGGGGGEEDALTEFEKSINAAYKLEAEKPLMVDLAAFYAHMRGQVDKQTSWLGLFKAMQEAAVTFKVSGKLPNVQSVIGAELRKTFPSGQLTEAQVLTAADKVNVKVAFDQVLAAIKKAK